MESLFEFLFKYRPVLFREGDVVLRGPWPVVTLLLAGLAIAAVVGYSYLRPRGRAGNVDRAIDQFGMRPSVLASPNPAG